MSRTVLSALFCSLFFLAQSRGQDVFVPRQLKAIPVPQSEKEAEAPPPKAIPVKDPAAGPRSEKIRSVKAEPAKAPAVKETAKSSDSEKVHSVKAEPVKAPSVKEPAVKPHADKVQVVRAESVKAPAVKDTVANSHSEKVKSTKAALVETPTVKEPAANPHAEQTQTVKAESAKASTVKEPAENPHSKETQTAKAEPLKVPTIKEPVANLHAEKVKTVKAESVKPPTIKEPEANPRTEKVKTVKAESVKEPATNPHVEKVQTAKTEPVKAPVKEQAPEPTVNVRLVNGPMETASTRLADGFDFPVGKPEAEGYYKARGYRSGGHMGEDWDGVRGGDTDFNDPIYCIGDGIVVFARDVHLGWGNVVIVRHAFRENGGVKHIDSLYGHLNKILVRRGQRIARGQQLGTMGTAHGQYDAHLHLEIRKNLEIGMSRSKFQKNFSNYYDPSQFIASHRHLSGGGASFRVAMNTFTHDSAYHFDDSPNFSARKRSTAESSAALKRAISSTTP